MSRYGLFCFLGRGHLDPGLAIGRRLQACGHDVTIFHISIAEAAVRRARLGFVAIDRSAPNHQVSGQLGPWPRRTWLSTVSAVMTHAERTLREAPQAIRERKIDAIVADQLDVAVGTVAERAGVPFVSVSCGPPLYLDDSVPPPYFGWFHASGPAAAARNRRGNAMVERVAAPVLALINDTRRAWQLAPISCVNQLFSPRGIITQLPAILELPRVVPPSLFYTGQFRDDSIEPSVPFDCARLSSRPLVYASMGTVRNTSPAAFRMIAEAAADLDVQLVISLGGGALQPKDLGALPGDPLVVHYAPQRTLLARADVTVNCGGLNTTLDSLWCGVPMVAMPVAEDQPGVSARIDRSAVGIVEPFETITVARLRDAMVSVLTQPQYRDAARRVQSALVQINGTEQAVDLIERLVASPAGTPVTVDGGR
jgi:zeaxanthin glucosyltransferase